MSKIFEKGNKVEENFMGDAWLNMIFTDAKPLNAPIGSVTFNPGSRNNWHEHKVGQVLIVIDGTGWYQEWGEKAKLITAGDVINILPNVKHWHGATKSTSMVHLALTPGDTKWLEVVSDEQYNKL